MEQSFISVPKRFIVYCNSDPDVADPYTVVYPDGAVFVFFGHSPFHSRFLCHYNNFSKDENDEVIRSVPEVLMEAIINQEI